MAIAVGVLLLVAGSTAAYFSLRTSSDVPRAVPGVPGAPAGQATEADGGLPSGHPSIELPKQVLDFLAALTAEAEKNPQSVEIAQKLARARYRASVINGSYRASAEQALANLLALDPGNSEGLRISANIAYDAGEFPEARKRFETYLAKFPDDVSAITDLGSTMLFQDQVDEAVKQYQSAIAKDDKFMQAHFNLGIALQKQGKKGEAIASLKRAVELASKPEEKQHVENALAELEGRQPAQIAGAQPAAAEDGAPSAATQGGPAPGGMGGAPGAMGGAPGGMGGAPGAMGGAPGGGMGGGMAMPPPAPARKVPTNATSAFQQQVEGPLITHPMIGPRVVGFDWNGPGSLRVKIAQFPMDNMPPFARAKFKTATTDKLLAAAAATGFTGPVKVEMIDDDSGRVMETLDAVAAAATAPPSPGAGQ